MNHSSTRASRITGRRTGLPTTSRATPTSWPPSGSPRSLGCPPRRPRPPSPPSRPPARGRSVWTDHLTTLERYKARAYRIEPVPGRREQALAYIAYPLDLFEEGSVTNMMARSRQCVRVQGAARAAARGLRIPVAYVKTFQGPPNGIQVERDTLNKYGRPLLGARSSRSSGFPRRTTAAPVTSCCVGGLDFTKDDENITSQPFMRWRDRFTFVMEAVRKAEERDRRAQGPLPQRHRRRTSSRCWSGPSTRRSSARRSSCTTTSSAGFAAHQTLSNWCRRNGMLLHVHRALHAVIDRQKNHGINFRVLAKWLRLAGGDHLHSGTVVGKLEGDRADDARHPRPAARGLRSRRPAPAGIFFDQDWASLPGGPPRRLRRDPRLAHARARRRSSATTRCSSSAGARPATRREAAPARTRTGSRSRRASRRATRAATLAVEGVEILKRGRGELSGAGRRPGDLARDHLRVRHRRHSRPGARMTPHAARDLLAISRS